MSRSPLESQDFFAKFFFFFSKLENILRFLFLISIFWQKFSFSSLTRKQISTFLFSLLETRDMDSIFLFLLLISLFGISSMPENGLCDLSRHEKPKCQSDAGNCRRIAIVRKLNFPLFSTSTPDYPVSNQP